MGKDFIIDDLLNTNIILAGTFTAVPALSSPIATSSMATIASPSSLIPPTS